MYNIDEIKKYLSGRNLSLIGMPGSGKTTVATLMARRYKLRYVDTDQIISKAEEMSINEIFAKYGEEKFRQLETECIRRVSRYSNVVISTGGGVVTRAENMKLLKKNSFIIFLDRDVNDIFQDIDISKRPLLKDGPERIKKLYDERIGLYTGYADVIIKNNGDFDEILRQVDDKLMNIMEVL